MHHSLETDLPQSHDQCRSSTSQAIVLDSHSYRRDYRYDEKPSTKILVNDWREGLGWSAHHKALRSP